MFRITAALCLASIAQTATAEPTSMLVFAGPPGGWIKEYDLSGAFVQDLLEPREFAAPQYGAIGPDGLLYVSSWTTHRVVKMDLAGNIVSEVVPNDGVVVGKTFLTIRDDELIVSGSLNGAIGVYDVNTGAYRGNLVEEGVLDAAHTVVWLDSGDMLVTDIVDNSIRRFGSDGSYLGYFSDDAVLGQPAGMELSPDGSMLYVSNFSNGQINMFDIATGDYTGQLFQAGTAADDLTYGPDGMLYAASYGTNSIYRYDFDTGTAEVFIDGTSGLRGPNSVLFIPSSGTVVVIGAGLLPFVRRRRTA